MKAKGVGLPKGGVMTTAATAIQPSRNYIQDSRRLGIVLGAFFVLTVPLSIWSLRENSSLILLAYTIVFGVTHFLVKTLPRVASEMALHVLAHNLTRVMNIMGSRLLLAAIRA